MRYASVRGTAEMDAVVGLGWASDGDIHLPVMWGGVWYKTKWKLVFFAEAFFCQGSIKKELKHAERNFSFIQMLPSFHRVTPRVCSFRRFVRSFVWFVLWSFVLSPMLLASWIVSPYFYLFFLFSVRVDEKVWFNVRNISENWLKDCWFASELGHWVIRRGKVNSEEILNQNTPIDHMFKCKAIKTQDILCKSVVSTFPNTHCQHHI